MTRLNSTGQARALTRDEIQRLHECASPRDRAILWTCLGGGLRIGETCRLLVGQLGSDWGVTIDRHSAKGKKTRKVFISLEARPYIQAWVGTRGLCREGDYLYPSRKGGYVEHGSQLVEQLMMRAGVRGASSHSLRRTHAQALRAQHADLEVIKAQMGHSSIAVTERYLSQYPLNHQAHVERLVLLG